MKAFHRWIKINSVILLNAGSLVGTTVITSALGFVYWWVAARRYPPTTVGTASAFISTMTLLGTFCVMGTGTLLITELPRQRARAGSLISTALLTVGIVGGLAGFLCALLAPRISPEFAPLQTSMLNCAIFAAGVSLTSITMVSLYATRFLHWQS
jgi:O-antigen/teichoic acid export membrane protein